MAIKYALVGKDFPRSIAKPDDALDGQLYTGPLSRHLAEQALKALPKADGHKIVPVEGSGGSLTALPIIETLLGDVSAYIPTNVISITDGQIYLESNLFNAGIRPAINVGISVSRVGGSAQTKAIKQVAARLRMEMAAYRELAAFAQFGSDLDKVTQSQLSRGQRLQEILKQPQYTPYSLASQVISLFAATNVFADAIPVEKIRLWETALLRFMEVTYPEIVKDILEKKQITTDNEAKLRQALTTFNLSWQA
jgi:F-type H+-transporting ATPase subunit alpha